MQTFNDIFVATNTSNLISCKNNIKNNDYINLLKCHKHKKIHFGKISWCLNKDNIKQKFMKSKGRQLKRVIS